VTSTVSYRVLSNISERYRDSEVNILPPLRRKILSSGLRSILVGTSIADTERQTGRVANWIFHDSQPVVGGTRDDHNTLESIENGLGGSSLASDNQEVHERAAAAEAPQR
jgi:hypothetical protein